VRSNFFKADKSDFLDAIGVSENAGGAAIDSAYRSWAQSGYVSQSRDLYKYSFISERKDTLFQKFLTRAENIDLDTVGTLNAIANELIGTPPQTGGLMCLTPFTYYENVSRREEESVNFHNMAHIRSDITESVVASSRSLDIPMQIMNPSANNSTSTTIYNTMGMLSEWVDCKITFEDSTILVMPFPITTVKRMEEISGGSQVVNCGYIQLQSGREIHPYAYITILMSVTLPNLAWTLTKPHFAAAYYFQVFDLRTGWIEYDELARMDHQAYRSSMISTHIYHSLRSVPK